MTCEVHCGDMLELLPRWAAEGFSCDAIITDPPYHLASIAKRFGKEGSAPAKHGRDGAAARLSKGFMGSATDEGDVSFRPETWKACLDVLVPGGRALVFGGPRTWWKTAAAMDAAGFEIEDTIMWVYGQGLVLRRSRLKPCYEPIIMGRKKGPVHDLNIDECRTPTTDNLTTHASPGGYSGPSKGKMRAREQHLAPGQELGRLPGNLIADGSDEVLSCFPDAPGQQGDLTGHSRNRPTISAFGNMKPAHDAIARSDSGSAARFFTECRFEDDESRLIYEGKAAGRERVFRCKACGEHAFRRDRDAHLHGAAEGDWAHLLEHPTVKPVSLLTHLCRLVVPPGGLVCDPFAGTGSLAVAALRAGRNAVLIERDAIHAETCRFRLAARIKLVASFRRTCNIGAAHGSRSMHKSRKTMIVISAERPSGVTRSDFTAYAHDAVVSNIGGLHPDDPMFEMRRDSVMAHTLSNDFTVVVEHMLSSPIKRRQAIACLKDSPTTKGWFNTAT